MNRGWYIAAGICFILAAILKFALVGYGTSALLLTAAGVVALIYPRLPFRPRRILTGLLLMGVILFVLAEIPIIRAAGGDQMKDADYIIVLGAGVNGSTPSLSMVNRLEATLDYLETYPDCVAILSGGQGSGENISEADAMARWLRERGIAGERLVLETESTSTEENLKNSLRLIPDASTQSIGVVSSEYHLYRAKIMAAALGYSVAGIPAHTSILPLKLNYFIREAFAVVYLWLKPVRF